MDDPGKQDELLNEVQLYLRRHKHLPIEESDDKKDPYEKLHECKHRQVEVDKEARKVICKECHKELDPFWYLLLLAREWKSRRYDDAQAIQARIELEQNRLNKGAREKIIVRPETGEPQQIWDDFVKWKGYEPNSIWKERRMEWMAEGIESRDGREYRVTYGHSYIKMMIAGKR
jgi:hypothetical protein